MDQILLGQKFPYPGIYKEKKYCTYLEILPVLDTSNTECTSRIASLESIYIIDSNLFYFLRELWLRPFDT